MSLLALLLLMSPVITALASPNQGGDFSEQQLFSERQLFSEQQLSEQQLPEQHLFSEQQLSEQQFNEELLRFLAEEYGIEEAATLFETIEHLGLVDGNGLFVDHAIYFNGEPYTLEELRLILADEQTDLTQMVEIDGDWITLDILKKIIIIEDELEMLRQALNFDDVVITSEHLDSLDSLIRQLDAEGFMFNHNSEPVSILGAENGDFINSSDDLNLEERDYPFVEAFDDTIYITVTEQTYLDAYTFSADEIEVKIKFELNKEQDVNVSFSFELIAGALNSIDGTTFSVDGNDLEPGENRITFEPGQTEKTLRINSGPVVNTKPGVEVNFDSATQYMNEVWGGKARTDYIHFKDFVNLDYMKFEQDVNDYYSPFKHVYEGGAYLSYVPINGKGSDLLGYDDLSLYGASFAMHYAQTQGLDVHSPPNILEVHAKPGIYTTGQIVPMRVHFSNFNIHAKLTYGINTNYDNNNPRLVLGNGQIATPAIMKKSHFLGIHSYILGYQTIIAKDTKADGLKVIKSTEEASLDAHFAYVDFNRSYLQIQQNYVDGLIDEDEKIRQIAELNAGYYGENGIHAMNRDKINPDASWNKDFTNNPDITIMPARSDAFRSIAINKKNYEMKEILQVRVELENANGESDWLLDGGLTPDDISKNVIVSLGKNRGEGMVELDWERNELGLPVEPYVLQGQIEVTEELRQYVSDDHRLRAKIYYNRDPSNSGENLDKFGVLFDKFVYFSLSDTVLIQDLVINYPTIWPSGEKDVVYLTSAQSTQLSYDIPEGTYNTADEFEWVSSDESVADMITHVQNGVKIATILPKKDGHVTFRLIANNGGYNNPQYEVESVVIQIRAGGDPVVTVPDYANQVHVQEKNDANIAWTTNVMAKYKSIAEPGMEPVDVYFDIALYKGFLTETEILTAVPIQTWHAADHDELINATSFTIPGELLTDISNLLTPSYTVKISTPHPFDSAKILTAQSYIVVKANPAVVKLDKKMGQYSIDHVGAIDLTWALEDFMQSNEAAFEFKVTKNGELLPQSVIQFDQATETFIHPNNVETPMATQHGGSYELIIEPVDDMTKRVKDVYAITLAVRNSSDTAWSYDSLYLQVYKKDAFRIHIDGQYKTEHEMSNIENIRNMTNDERIALNRDISLKNNMSINNNDYTDMGQMSDQFIWESSNNDVGVINFVSNGTIADIEKFHYDSFQPKHNFILSGIESGQTTITATHASTGMKTELDVNIETLRDKLYLFQFYPKTETTITYTNKEGIEETATSNANGELALFDEHGIASDVYVTSKFNGTTYTGVLSHETLLSKEKDPALLELYPINILQLRKLSKVEVFFKTPDGKPYTGKVTYRGGVYKNGNYCEATDISGVGRTVSLEADDNGRIEVIFDTTDFFSVEAGEVNAGTLSAKDHIDLVFEFMFEDDRYYPQLITVDGNTNPIDMVTFAEKILLLRDNITMQKTPFMVNQIVLNDVNHTRSDILTYNGKFGPNNQFPNLTLLTEFMWWGEEPDQELVYAELFNEVGAKPRGQSHQVTQYPFSDVTVTQHYQVLNEDTIWLDQAESGSFNYKLYDNINSFRKSFVSQPALINMIGVEEVNITDLIDELENIREDMTITSVNNALPSHSDNISKYAFVFLDALKFNVGPLQMKIIPTNDPLVYKTIIAASFGGLPSTGAGNDSGGSGDIEFMKNEKSSFVPGLMDAHQMSEGKYWEKLEEKYTNDLKGKANGRGMFSVGGYYLGEIKYNTSTREWESITTAGGFHAGGGYELTENLNQMVGPVPVTYSVTVGGAVEIDFKASILYDALLGYEWSDRELTSVNDYLTSLRVIAYIELFGGLGFDYTVVAAKIGMFGRITLDNTTTWLNRDYLEKASERVKFGNKLTMEGVVGIKAVVKFLFFSRTHTFTSLRYSHTWVYNNWDAIQDYWDEYGTSLLTAGNIEVAIASYINHIGEEDMHVFETTTLEDRSYLSRGGRAWHAIEPSHGFGIMSLDQINEAPSVLQSNAYPYSNPQLSDDGKLFVYLSDGDSVDVQDTVASWARYNGAGYEDQGEIIDDGHAFQGFGDSNLQVAGEGDHIAAVWVTQKEKIEKEAGEDISNADIMLMNNSTEIMASIYNGTEWTTHRLTDNMNPDLAPVVSVSNEKVFVAYRSVYTNNLDNPLDFSASDSIVYTVYDMLSGEWSDVETLYNGTNGTVMGLSAATLSNEDDGDRTAIVYTVNNGDWKQSEDENYVAAGDNQIIYTVINTEKNPDASAQTWRTKGVIKNLQVTNDNNANDNPQITNVVFSDDVERFVIAWHTTSEEAGGAKHDIKLLAFDRDGEVYSELIDSLGDLQAYNAIQIHPNFTFVKMPKQFRTIDNLSLLWKEAELETNDGVTESRDVIKAVKFGIDQNDASDHVMYLSGAIKVATMPDETAVDMVDAYVSESGTSGYEIKALILGTTYTTDVNVIGEITLRNPDEEGDKIPVVVSEEISGMYTATETYSNVFEVDEIAFSPNEIVIGYDLPIQFSLVNQGINKIDTVTIKVGGQETVFKDLALFPNNSRTMTALYTVPALITDVNYHIDVTFSNGSVLSDDGIITLDRPDLGLSTVTILQEEGGKRQLSIPIYNKNDTTLDKKGRVVKFGLYSNTIYTDHYLIGDVISISDDNALQLIDQGAYTTVVEFDIQSYLTTLGLTEIPDKGITIFLHSWVEDADGGVIVEFDRSNNDAKVWFENLASKYRNDHILLTLEQTNSITGTSANLTMQNMNMAPVDSGNVVLHLLDVNGDVIESQYVVTSSTELLEFKAEEKKQEIVHFVEQGDMVQAMFFQESADTMDATLSSVSISGVQVGFDANKPTTYRLQASDLKEVQIQAAAANNQATVTLLDGAGNTVISNQGHILVTYPLLMSLAGTENELRIVVEAESETVLEPNEYHFTIVNVASSQPQLQIQVTGTMTDVNEYVGQVVLSLPRYDLSGFKLEQASYKINDGHWVTVNYDGTEELEIARLSDVGDHTIMAKVKLASGSEHALETVKFNIRTGSGSSSGSGSGSQTNTDDADSNDQSTARLFHSDIIDSDKLHEAIREKLQSTEGGQSFADTTSHWAARSIHILVRLGTVKGYPDGSFLPDKKITRAEFVSMVVRLFAIDDQGDRELDFTDTPHHWANEAIETLASHGIINGYGTGQFRPDETITRQDAVVIIMRLLDMKALPKHHSNEMSDLEQAGAYARNEIEAATAAGIINGYDDGTFRPQGHTTRAEVVTMLLRLLQLDESMADMLANFDITITDWF